ncbi:hypothetical protein H310_00972 [Aphanomyces invadans]|uniref:Uncharacterized protein n=1 Tax=Aphanomyces invadans TaxID=157072 RepID=A0A024URX3_9STRA|nr:hypothetical protein H310_00972 [Aphanomyces invadans]ETW08378.1 hypothetical protein H310_00972 [Aphanomyces invadans]|eukprot:XP_008862183.1 hypothetical protein H310_00972 [Aphanomyces invadans]
MMVLRQRLLLCERKGIIVAQGHVKVAMVMRPDGQGIGYVMADVGSERRVRGKGARIRHVIALAAEDDPAIANLRGAGALGAHGSSFPCAKAQRTGWRCCGMFSRRIQNLAPKQVPPWLTIQVGQLTHNWKLGHEDCQPRMEHRTLCICERPFDVGVKGQRGKICISIRLSTAQTSTESDRGIMATNGAVHAIMTKESFFVNGEHDTTKRHPLWLCIELAQGYFLLVLFSRCSSGRPYHEQRHSADDGCARHHLCPRHNVKRYF